MELMALALAIGPLRCEVSLGWGEHRHGCEPVLLERPGLIDMPELDDVAVGFRWR